MNTAAKPPFSINARYIGPVFSLTGQLTKSNQNLIFARNGTGKSFLSRAFRYLDLHGQTRDIADASVNLVSDESEDGKGSFSFLRGGTALGTLQLDKVAGSAVANLGDCIFHVFSEDFVQEELRERKYELDGEIENEITIDSENIKLDDAKSAVKKSQSAERVAYDELSTQFETDRSSELLKKAGINKQLKEYKELTLDALLERYAEKPSPPDPSFADILKDLDSLKAIPAEPVYPAKVDAVPTSDFDMSALQASLETVTSPSSVSADIKKRIDAHHGFYELGAQIVREEHRTSCPFCEQGIVAPGPKEIIDAYLAYFEDEEEKHRSVLRRFSQQLRQKEALLSSTETQLARQRAHYDDLKRHVPSKKDTIVSDWQSALASARKALAAVKSVIEAKEAALATIQKLPTEDFSASISDLNAKIAANNDKAGDLARAVEKADDERKTLQRKACAAFEREFANRDWSKIDALRVLGKAVVVHQAELVELEKFSPSKSARDRVAATFELLLKAFFGKKYAFDKASFTLKRGNLDMTRGPHRTLSDGEKTAIAFCYFIACVHKKVENGSDYRKLFLVFDDPVTSMSYDFVFEIAQTLKNLNFSVQGDISTNPGMIDGNKFWKPELLILTHSSYFFNISVANRVVDENAAFALHNDGTKHVLVRLNRYVAPFQQQLIDVHDVANGKDPDHGTGNAIRSVLEAVGRFCRPDKADSLTNFLSHLAGEGRFMLKSTMINSLCHGTYYDETPPPDDIVMACKETIDVVTHFAPGQLELIRAVTK
jgi:hypothetical protein